MYWKEGIRAGNDKDNSICGYEASADSNNNRHNYAVLGDF